MSRFIFFRLLSFVSVLTIVLILSGSVCAAPRSTGIVKIGNTVVIRFLDDGTTDPQERADIIQDRIDNLIQQGALTAEDVRVVKEEAGYTIYWGGNLVITVDAEQAKLNKTKPELLAGVWAQNLKKAIQLNAFYVIPNRVEMPVNGAIRVRIAGPATGVITKELEEGGLDLDLAQEGEELIVKARRLGKGVIVLKRGNYQTRLVVFVKELAAAIPEKIETEVSGDPVPKNIIQYAAQNAVRNYIRLKPGAVLKINSEIKCERYLKKGRSTLLKVPIEAEGQGYISVVTEVPVIVNNTGEGFPAIKKLMVSDRPEAIEQDGILFTSSFTQDEPTRLLFYHMNSSRENRIVWIDLENPSLETIRLQMCSAWAGPDRMGVTVGHTAASRFLEACRSNVNYTIFIPPREKMTIVQVSMGQEQILAGYIHMNIVKGRELKVVVKNQLEIYGSGNGRTLPLLHQPFDPFKIHPKGVFKPADLHMEVEYEVGQEEIGACTIGQAPWLIDPVTGEPNNGNYGVFYDFMLKLTNPTDKRQRLGLFFVPDGLLAQGTFLLDGKMIETGLVRKPDRYLFAVTDLAPGEKKDLKIITTPEGGSYYPARIVVEPVGPDEQPKNGKKQDPVEEPAEP